MISAGEEPLVRMPRLDSPVWVSLDIDFPPETLPSAASCPLGGVDCDDGVQLWSEVESNRVRDLVAVFHSEVTGLFGNSRRFDGASSYAITLDEHGRMIARKVNPNGTLGKQYSLEDPRWVGAQTRVAVLVAEALAGWEMGTRLATEKARLPGDPNANPAYQLALWLNANGEAVFAGIPESYLTAFSDLPKVPLQVDLDDHSDKGYEPSLAVVGAALNTNNDHILAFFDETAEGRVPCIQFFSEVDVPELGGKAVRLSQEGLVSDPAAERMICATPHGLKVMDPVTRFEYPPTISGKRLAHIVAGAFVAIGNELEPLSWGPSLYDVSEQVTTVGEMLPEAAQFRPGWFERAFIILGQGIEAPAYGDF